MEEHDDIVWKGIWSVLRVVAVIAAILVAIVTVVGEVKNPAFVELMRGWPDYAWRLILNNQGLAGVTLSMIAFCHDRVRQRPLIKRLAYNVLDQIKDDFFSPVPEVAHGRKLHKRAILYKARRSRWFMVSNKLPWLIRWSPRTTWLVPVFWAGTPPANGSCFRVNDNPGGEGVAGLIKRENSLRVECLPPIDLNDDSSLQAYAKAAFISESIVRERVKNGHLLDRTAGGFVVEGAGGSAKWVLMFEGGGSWPPAVSSSLNTTRRENRRRERAKQPTQPTKIDQEKSVTTPTMQVAPHNGGADHGEGQPELSAEQLQAQGTRDHAMKHLSGISTKYTKLLTEIVGHL